MKKSLMVYAVVTALFVAVGTGCSNYNDERGKGDAPVAGRKGDDSPAKVSNMPDAFPNAAAKCLAGFPPYAFVTTTEKGILLFQAPDQCGGKAVPGTLAVVGN